MYCIAFNVHQIILEHIGTLEHHWLIFVFQCRTCFVECYIREKFATGIGRGPKKAPRGLKTIDAKEKRIDADNSNQNTATPSSHSANKLKQNLNKAASKDWVQGKSRLRRL